ncbi:GGDEF domain-containing protein [Dokdonella immobilis]|uniref:PAS domain S-box-containing protein/diguanylate cyclase (GGDEF) domain-containing protein n=1 Tax=Dokdonella immobilis TaxID=578942 RepID=A0A1I4XYJ1_9GAMM|nr:GGDEF domain-containing protein [Dokdonella immobilis]SFN30847.1 PAS domain S-box-containing protein/diguanylate cyclase (GGDEF) domain-containing protein [Dokdonella immobilis]
MVLDIRTVVIVAALIALIIGVSLWFALRNQKAAMVSSIRIWMLGVLLLPTGWVLYGLRGLLSDFVTIVVANGLLSLGFAKLVEAVRDFVGRPRNRALIYLPVLAVVLGEAVFSYLAPNPRVRGVLVAAIIGVQLAFAVSALMARAIARPRSHQLTAAAFLLLSLVLLVRAAHELFQPHALPGPFAFSLMQSIAFGLAAAFPIAATLGFLSMCNDRLNLALVRNQAHFRAITDHMPAIVAHIDTREQFTFANAYLARLLGVEPDDFVGRTLQEVFGPAAYAEIAPHVPAVLQGTAPTFEMAHSFQGKQRFFEASFVPDLDSTRGVCGFFVLLFDISRLKLAKEELARVAQCDSLTGLANRKAFGESLDRALARPGPQDRLLGLLYIDIDHFKSINDRYGHLTGDGVLCEFSARLKRCIRESDLAARLGGDEFAVLIEDAESSEAIETVARKLLDMVRVDFVVDGHALRVGVSIGIGISRSGADPTALLRMADEALYEAKVAGRDGFCIARVGIDPVLSGRADPLR